MCMYGGAPQAQASAQQGLVGLDALMATFQQALPRLQASAAGADAPSGASGAEEAWLLALDSLQGSAAPLLDADSAEAAAAGCRQQEQGGQGPSAPAVFSFTVAGGVVSADAGVHRRREQEVGPVSVAASGSSSSWQVRGVHATCGP